MQTVNVFATHCCDGVIILAIWENPRQYRKGMAQVLMMATRCKSTLSRKATRKANCKNCCRTGHSVKDCWRPGGRADNNSNKNQKKGKNNTTGKGKGPRGGRGATSQSSETASTLSCPSQTPRTIQALWCNPDTQQKGWIMTLGGVTMSFTVSNSETSWCRRLAS